MCAISIYESCPHTSLSSRNSKVVNASPSHQYCILSRHQHCLLGKLACTLMCVRRSQVDLETTENPSPLPREAYGAALVFNYLHRPLIPNLRDSVKSGGVVLYKTFTWEHPSVGVRPSNPAFLLGPSELKDELFAGWEVLHFFEGVEVVEDKAAGTTRRAAVSSIVCRKPSSG